MFLYKHDGENWNVYEKRYVRDNAVTYLSLCNTIRSKSHPIIRVPHHGTNSLTLTVLVTTIDALQHFETG